MGNFVIFSSDIYINRRTINEYGTEWNFAALLIDVFLLWRKIELMYLNQKKSFGFEKIKPPSNTMYMLIYDAVTSGVLICLINVWRC